MSRKRVSSQRGLTIPEVLTASMVAAIVMTITISIVRPAVIAANTEQAQTDLVNSTDEALYRIQRDIRQSDPNGIFVCSGSTPPSTCFLGSSLATVTQTNYMVILTGHTGGDGPMNWDNGGRPAWTGFEVYWIEPDANGKGNVLRYCFAPALIQAGTAPVVLNADVVNAVASAMLSPNAETVAHSIGTVQTIVNVSKDSVAVRIESVSSGQSSDDSTVVQSDTYARN